MAQVTFFEAHPEWPNKLRFGTDDSGFSALGLITMQNSDLDPNTFLPGVRSQVPPDPGPGGTDFIDSTHGTDFVNGSQPSPPFVLWRFDEASGAGPTCAAEFDSAYDLTCTGSVPTDNVLINEQAAWNNARDWAGDTGEVAVSAGGGAGIPSDFGGGNVDHVVYTIIKIAGGRSDPATILSVMGDPANTATDVDNEQFRLVIETDNRITVEWEYDDGMGNARTLETVTTKRSIPNGYGQFIAVQRRDDGLGTCWVEVYVNGDLWERFEELEPPSGGTSTDMQVGIGRRATESINPFKGIIDTTACFDVAGQPEATCRQGVITDCRQLMMPFPVYVPMGANWTGSDFTPNLDGTAQSTLTMFPVAYGQAFQYGEATPEFEPITTAVEECICPPPPNPPSPTAVIDAFPIVGDQDIYGVDFKSVPDMSFDLLRGQRVVAEALYRRFTTTRGTLLFHPDYGFDLRSMLNESITTDGLVAAKLAIEREAAKDERVFDLAVTLNFIGLEVLECTFAITTAQGPFQFVIKVSQLTTELLFQTGA